MRKMLSWVLECDSRANLQLFAEPDYLGNVISNYYRCADPRESLRRLLRKIMELDEPHLPHPPNIMRIWAVEHEPWQAITADVLHNHVPSAVYIRRNGAYRLIKGVELHT